MEHRCSVRKPYEFQLLIYKNGLPVQSSVSRNLGLGGVFIKAGTSAWRKNECLEVEFLGCGKAGMRLPAVVVHQSARGVGLGLGPVLGRGPSPARSSAASRPRIRTT